MDKRVQMIHTSLHGYPTMQNGCYGFVFRSSFMGRLLRKKYFVPLEGTNTEVKFWLQTASGFTAINQALKFFGYTEQYDNVVVDYKNNAYHFYNIDLTQFPTH